ncbi:hypothetical protein BE20_13490 [Sorangium cellulosum]|uniref:Uncharacterized protein n=1 Tax=Sorangium cellulosum TaxID=56 RepID=A0A150SM60_SORCE|nr:hypothetical protein BE20_13490 [Sorangium cellulosum]KYF93522.1 hypothetical protein BE18_30540 [Sorangium cellulosum]
MVLAVIAVLAGVVALILYALVMVLLIPAVWFLLGVGGVGYAIYRVTRRIVRERLEVLFLDTVAALHASDPRAAELLDALEQRGKYEADACLLVAADAASRAQYQDALAALERAATRALGIGRLSSGMLLAFPGLPASLSFRPEGGGAGNVEVAIAQMHVLAGTPRMALDALKLSTSDPAYPLGVCALADAHVALGEVDQATKALAQAADAPSCAPELSRSLRYKLARLLEDHESRSAAIREYKALVAQGGHEDAAERLQALRAELKRERRREEEARGIEEEARRRSEEEAQGIQEAQRRIQEEAQRREALNNAVAHSEELRAGGYYGVAAMELRRALELAMDEETARALRYKLAVTLEDAGSPMQAAAEFEVLGDYQDAVARREAIRVKEQARQQAIRVEEQARRQRALRAQEQETLEQALAKLEAARGPAGRRSAVRAGLDRLTLQELRDQLLLEASRIEVDAVLEKADGLKTAAAKRRHLLAGLEALRADEIPDELQAQQIRWLEEALAALET